MTTSAIFKILTGSSIIALTACGGGGDSIYEIPVSTEQSYHFASLNFDRVLHLGLTGQGVTVAVIDSGLDMNNPYFNNISDLSYNYVYETAEIWDSHGHGTAMASLIAGGVYPGIGQIGMAPDVSLMILQAGNVEGYFDQYPLINSINHAIDNGADIISMSLGGYYGSTSDPDVEAIKRATDNGIIVAMSLGNNGYKGGYSDYYPQLVGNYFGETAVTVGALDNTGNIAGFSSECNIPNPEYCIMVPGTDVIEFDLANGVQYGSGTSQATAIFAGSAALMLEYFPNLTNAEIVEIMLLTADDLGDPGIDYVYGVGALNLENALQPIGTLTFGNDKEASNLNSSYVYSDNNTMSLDFAESHFLKEVGVYDDYDRRYISNLSGRAVIVTKGLEFDQLESNASTYLKYDDIDALPSIDHFFMRIGDLSTERTNETSLTFANADALFNPYSDFANLDFEVGAVYNGDKFAPNITFASTAEDDFDHWSLLIGAKSNISSTLSIDYGISYLKETEQFLGLELSGAFGAVSKAETTGIHLGLNYTQNNFSAFIRGHISETNVELQSSDAIIESVDTIQANSFALGFGKEKIFNDNDRIDIAYERSFAANDGHVIFNSDIVDAEGNDAKASIASSSRESVTELSYKTDIGKHSFVKFSAAYLENSENVENENDIGFGFQFGVNF